jgi:hypothetical protein
MKEPIAVAARCDNGVGFHVKAGVAHGAICPRGILETLGMAIYMTAGTTEHAAPKPDAA